MKEDLLNMADKYGGFVIGGLVGAVVHRVRNTMSFRQFLGVVFISAFVGFCVGVVMRNYLHVSDEVIFVACSVSGVFSKDILNELQEVISYVSLFVKKHAKIGEKEV
ncbi:hypothetical protein [Tenacibaculum maritimum]|uniref:hypothetical protein n=2 Tax=Tenacibaculum maritimum TaxID=107401 RepID=UPI0012E6A58B|nr:hypothetical protein [Tenacibaculum maritimum]CAA0156697.1 conserved hypothetical protein [Tenacibaculum maritimum]CAA0172591.1 conserved hypothetical protein [Tenacibaculum maritimum]CAA0238939.1 conserved hypothetical protein [Tenacibaculum maritimum]